MIRIPGTLEADVDALVQDGTFASKEEAVAELLRLGLAALRQRSPTPRPGPPPAPPMPPGVGQPPGPRDDEPISVDPRDSRWL